MGISTPDEWSFAFIAFVAWFARYECSATPRARGAERDAGAYYRALDSLPVPGWAFGVVWFVLYALNAGATYAYWDQARFYVDDDDDSDDMSDAMSTLSATSTLTDGGNTFDSHYTATLALIAVNLVLNKLWSPLFFGVRAPRAALLVLVGCWGTALGVAVLFGVDSQWLSFGLWVPYVVWLSIALYLNARFLAAYGRELRRSMPAVRPLSSAAADPALRMPVRKR